MGWKGFAYVFGDGWCWYMIMWWCIVEMIRYKSMERLNLAHFAMCLGQ